MKMNWWKIVLVAQVINVFAAYHPAAAQSCSAGEQTTLDQCMVTAEQTCLQPGNTATCQRRYALKADTVGRFEEVCCCHNGAPATNGFFTSCKANIVSGIDKVKKIFSSGFQKQPLRTIRNYKKSSCPVACDF